jgi:hypothetical protein
VHAIPLIVTPQGGYRLSGSVDSDPATNGGYSILDLSDGGFYGLAVGTEVRSDGDVEIEWRRQQASAHAEGTGVRTPLADMTQDTVLFNGIYWIPDQPLNLYVLMGLGAAIFTPSGDYGSKTFFAGALALGTKFDLAKRVGLRLETRWSPVVMSSDSAVFCQGGGAGLHCITASSGQALNQFDFTAGLEFRFGQ